MVRCGEDLFEFPSPPACSLYRPGHRLEPKLLSAYRPKSKRFAIRLHGLQSDPRAVAPPVPSLSLSLELVLDHHLSRQPGFSFSFSLNALLVKNFAGSLH